LEVTTTGASVVTHFSDEKRNLPVGETLKGQLERREKSLKKRNNVAYLSGGWLGGDICEL